MWHELALAARLFEMTVFMIAAGLAVAMAIRLPTEHYRKAFLTSFALLCTGVAVGSAWKIRTDQLWNWYGQPFILASAVVAVVAFVIGWRSRPESTDTMHS